VKSIAAIALRCLLATALVTGGLSAWSMPDMSMAMGSSPQAGANDSAQQGSDCHPDGSGMSMDQASDQSPQDCCDKPEGECTHEKCDCVCPGLTIVVPAGSAAAMLANPQGPPPALSAPAPQQVTTTLLRPPRA